MAYWPAHQAHDNASDEETAAALGLDEAAARRLLARLGRWNPHY
ncbi:hypothetical protein [Streptomyces sp. NPDC008150]